MLFPIFLTITGLFFQLVFVQSFFDIGVKPGLIDILALQLLAALTSALLGLTVSFYVASQYQAYSLAAAYLLCLIFLTGHIYPLAESAFIVRLASCFFPLTYSGPVMDGWMARWINSVFYLNNAICLGVQFLIAVVVCTVSARRFRYTI